MITKDMKLECEDNGVPFEVNGHEMTISRKVYRKHASYDYHYQYIIETTADIQLTAGSFGGEPIRPKAEPVHHVTTRKRIHIPQGNQYHEPAQLTQCEWDDNTPRLNWAQRLKLWLKGLIWKH